MQQLEPGSHLAKIINYGFKLAQNGNEQVFLQFESEEGGKITWFGSLKTDINPKSGKSPCMRSVEQLLKLGFNNDWDSFGAEGGINCFPDKHWEIVLAEEEYQGKKSLKVQWINDPDAPRGMPKMEAPQSAAVVKSKDLKTVTAQIMSEMKASGSAPKLAQSSDVPF